MFVGKKFTEFNKCCFNSFTLSGIEDIFSRDDDLNYLEAISKQYPEFLIRIRKKFSLAVGGNLLHYSLKNKHSETVDYLLQDNTYISYIDEGGYNPVHLASICGNETVLEILVTRGCPFISTQLGVTPLHHAIMYGNLGCVEILLKYFQSITTLFSPLKGRIKLNLILISLKTHNN